MKKNTNQIMKLNIPIWIKYWLSKHKNASYILSEILTGTEFFLQDSAPKKFKIFDIIGRTTQESTTGKNLVPNTLTSGTYFGVNYKVNEDKSVTLNGTYSGSSNGWVRLGNNFILPTGTYTISSGNDNASTSTALFADDGSNFARHKIQTKTFENDITIKPYLMIGVGATFNNFTIYPMIVEGTYTAETMPAYEPYTGGEPAPNPNYVIPYKNTGDNVNEFDGEFELGGLNINNGEPVSHDSRIRTKNFIEINPNEDFTISGITAARYGCYYDENKVFISAEQISTNTSNNGTIKTPANAKYIKWHLVNITDVNTKEKLEQGTKATPYSPYGCGNVNEKVQNKNFLTNLEASANTTVTNGIVTQISVDTRSDLQWKIQTYNGTTKVEELPIIVKNTIGIFSRTFTKNSTFNRIRFGLNGSQRDTLVISDVSDLPDGEYTLSYNITNVTQGSISWKDVMITKATETDLTYVPHSEQNISFPLKQGQKFYEGSYPDDDEKVHHKMGEVVFDGSNDEQWGLSGSLQAFYSDDLVSTAKVNGNYLCNYFTKIANSTAFSDMKNGETKYNSISSTRIFFKNTDIANVTEWREWLSTHNLIVEYELAEEQTEDFTEEQKTAWEQIKALRTYKNVTHISSEDETPANLRIQYYKEG